MLHLLADHLNTKTFRAILKRKDLKNIAHLKKEEIKINTSIKVSDSVDMSLNKLWETVKEREAWCTTVPGVSKSQKRLND